MKPDKTLLKEAYNLLENLLISIDEERAERSQGHTAGSGHTHLENAYSKAEQWVDDHYFE